MVSSDSEKLRLRELLIRKVKSGEIKCPISKEPHCIDCKYLRICASKLEERFYEKRRND